MQKVTLSEYLARELTKYCDTVFAGNGGWVVNILDKIKKEKIKIVSVQNEQCASMSADAYSRIGGLGVCISTAGGGFLNMLSGIAGAYYDSVGILAIVGADSNLRKNRKIRQLGFQEMNVKEISEQFGKYYLANPKIFKEQLKEIFYELTRNKRQEPIILEIKDCDQRKEV